MILAHVDLAKNIKNVAENRSKVENKMTKFRHNENRQ